MAIAIVTGKTFASGETVTPTKLNLLGVPAITAGAGVFVGRKTASGAGAIEEMTPAEARTELGLGECKGGRAAADFSKTADTTFADITGISVNLSAGKTYAIRAVLYGTWGATGGIKINLNGTVTLTALISDFMLFGDGALISQVQAAALNVTGVSNNTAYAVSKIIIEGTITVNAAGTLTVRSAQGVANATPSTIKAGSTLQVWEIA